jgi:L-fuculose-phosphate aldolase
MILEKTLELSKSISRFTMGAEGNVSSKIDEDNFFIKKSGFKLSSLNKDGLMQMDFKGKSQSSKPSIEWGFHSFILNELNQDFVAHTHPVNTLKILCTDLIYDFAKKRLFPDQVVYMGKDIPIVDYLHPGEDLLNGIKLSMNQYLDKHNELPKLIFLKNHGIITYGKSIEQCIITTEICEKSAEIFLGCYNQANFLTEEEINRILEDDREKYRQKIFENNL